MKNSGKVLSVVTIVLQLFSLVSFFLVILLQRFFKGMMTSQAEVLEIFSFPVAQTFQILLLTVGVLLIVLGAFLKGKSFWAEILWILLIVLLCPLVARLGGILESTLMGNKGAMHIVSSSTLQAITAFPLMLAGMASSLSLVAAGLSMAHKKLSR